MAIRQILAGSTSQLIDFPVFDSSSTVGALLAGLVYNTSGLVAFYSRGGVTGSAVALTLVTMTKGTWTSADSSHGGFVAVDNTNIPGVCQLSIPDAALAAGAPYVTIVLKGAANMVPVVLVIELPTSVAQTGDSYARLGAPSGASVSVDVAAVKTDTAAVKVQTDKMTFTVANKMDSNVYTWNGTAVSAPATAGIPDVNVKNIANAAVNTASAQIGANVVSQTNIDFGALQKASLNAATPASVTGAVGSVTGAVGSVTGNVGGNVTGSVGSVTGAVGSVTGAVGSVTAAVSVTGDLSATMKTSVTTAASAATPAVTVSDKTGFALTAGEHTSIQTDAYNAMNTAYTDATSLNAGSLLDRMRVLGWIQRNKIAVTDASGNTVIYKDDNSTAAFTVSAMLTDDSTTTTRLRAA